MKPGLILLIAVIWLIIFVGFATPLIDPESTPGYAMSKSLVRDQDFSLGNDPIYWAREDLTLDSRGFAGRRTTSCSSGIAYGYYPFMKWLPDLSLTQLFVQNISHYRSKTVRSDGFAFMMGSLIWGVILIFISFRLLFERYSFGISHWAVFLVFIGTPLFFFTLASPGRSYILEACCLGFCLKFLDKARSDEVFHPEGYLFLSGLAAGFLLLTHNLLFPVVGIFWISTLFIRRHTETLRMGSAVIRLLIFLLGMAPSLILQGLHNSRYFGEWFRWSGAGQIVFPPDITVFSYLVFPAKGILIWFPLLIISMIGLIVMLRRDTWLGLTGLCLIGGTILAAAMAPGTMIDTCFGLSILIVLTTVFVLGVAEILSLRHVPVTAVLIVLTLITFMNSLLFTALIHGPDPVDGSLPNYRIWPASWSAMKARDIFSPFGFLDEALKEGDVPAVFPNLFRYMSMADNVLLLKLDGRFDLTDPDIIQGTLKVYSGSKNPANITYSLWPFLDKDKKYGPMTQSTEFNIPVSIPEGIQTIGWIYNHNGTLQFEIPGYEGRVSASRIVIRNTGREYLLQSHITMSVSSGGISRTMQIDLERPGV